jgi:hypothetical protein
LIYKDYKIWFIILEIKLKSLSKLYLDLGGGIEVEKSWTRDLGDGRRRTTACFRSSMVTFLRQWFLSGFFRRGSYYVFKFVFLNKRIDTWVVLDRLIHQARKISPKSRWLSVVKVTWSLSGDTTGSYNILF